VQALSDVSLVVREGEVVAVLGANGAGKTTTLRAISGTVSRSGTIELDGKALKGGPEAAAKAGIAHVPEGRGTFVDLNVTENLKLGAYTRRDSVKADLKRIAGYFPWMAERGSQRAGTLSGGEQQMLAIARAIGTEPKVLLLDELSMGLAPLVVSELYDVVKRIAADDVSILVVEQFAHEVLDVADVAAIILHGRVQFEGAPTAVADALQDAYLGGSVSL
jgi:branched-chain amino acid transport system ATP-binding protein